MTAWTRRNGNEWMLLGLLGLLLHACRCRSLQRRETLVRGLRSRC